MKIEWNSDSILSSCEFYGIFSNFESMRFLEVAEKMLFEAILAASCILAVTTLTVVESGSLQLSITKSGWLRQNI